MHGKSRANVLMRRSPELTTGPTGGGGALDGLGPWLL